MNAELRGLDALNRAIENVGVLRGANVVREIQAEARAALAALSVAQGQGWLPIESAPATGLLLTFHPRFGQRILRPDPHNAGWYLDETGSPTREVTHWQPLPAAPAQPDGVSK